MWRPSVLLQKITLTHSHSFAGRIMRLEEDEEKDEEDDIISYQAKDR